jgi:hypothetical protein
VLVVARDQLLLIVEPEPDPAAATEETATSAA